MKILTPLLIIALMFASYSSWAKEHVTGTVKDNVVKDSITIVAPWEIGSTELSQTGYMFTRLQIVETLVGVE